MNTAGRFKEQILTRWDRGGYDNHGPPLYTTHKTTILYITSVSHRSVEWTAEIGFLLQMRKKNFFLFVCFLIKQIVDAIARNSENKA